MRGKRRLYKVDANVFMSKAVKMWRLCSFVYHLSFTLSLEDAGLQIIAMLALWTE